LTAELNGTARTLTITVQPSASAFTIHGNSAELPSLSNNSAVSPSAVPPGVAGKVVVRGTGAVAFSPVSNGNGVSFTKGGQQNANTAFLSFAGPALSSLFNLSAGDLSFSIKSNHSFAERKALIPVSVFFQTDDGSRRIASFSTSIESGRLVFYFGAGGGCGYYYIPAGREDALFGAGVVARFRVTWSANRITLYLNDASVAVFPYTPPAPAWSSTASFAIGATSLNYYNGGYNAADDSIADFTIR
jgi:hypothetical protein